MRPDTVEPIGLLQGALATYREHFGVLFPLALIVGLVQAMIVLAFGSDDFTKMTTGQALATMVTLLPALVFLAFTVELLRDLRAGGEVRSTGELVRAVLPIVLPLFSIALLAAIATVIGLFLLIVPGLILATIWSVVLPVFVIERPRVILASFGRSRQLVRSHGWPVFGTVVLALVVALVGSIFGAILAIDPTSAVGSFVQLVVTSLVTPATTLLLAGLYFRLVDLHGPAAAAPASDPAHEAFGPRD